jgi:hypothetical protein
MGDRTVNHALTNHALVIALAIFAGALGQCEGGPSKTQNVEIRPVEVRGVYGRDSTASGLGDLDGAGFNYVLANPSISQLDPLAERGMKAVVGLWGYDNQSCSFNRSDRQIAPFIRRFRNHPAVGAWQLADEPNAATCPGAPAQFRDRSDLVASLDPRHPTYVVVSVWNGRESFPFEDFAGVTDIMGLTVYPCTRTRGCDLSLIRRAIQEVESDGVDRYWAVIQAFDGRSRTRYRMPSANELQAEFDAWAGSAMEGYFVYSWGPPAPSSLDDRPDLIAVLRHNNRRFAGVED